MWQRQDIVGVQFDLVDYAQVLATIRRWIQRAEPHYVALSNPHSVMLCRRNKAMRQATAKAGMTLPDGVGIILAAAMLGYAHRGRVTGPTLILRLCDWGRMQGFRHYFYGGAEGVAERLARRLCERYPGLEVAGTYCPPFRGLTAEEDRAITERINATRPHIVWVGLGAPKQEIWMAQHLGRIEATAMIGVGAAFDFHSGVVKWAPGWLRRLGLEGVYRTIQEPLRMLPRWLDDISFAVMVLAELTARILGLQSA